MAEKFAHEQALRGKDLIAKLAKFQITICGTGALGSYLSDTLVRQGVTHLRVIDKDRVEGHNVATQIFGDGDVGALKVAALKNRLYRDVGVEIETFDKELNAGTVSKFLKGSDLVIDTFDNNASRKLVSEFCREKKLQALHSGLYETYGEVVWDEEYTVPPDSVAGDVCDYPLARNLVTIVVAIAAEEVIDFCLSAKPRRKNWSLTLKDLAVRPYR